MLAAKYGWEEGVELFLDRGAEIDAAVYTVRNFLLIYFLPCVQLRLIILRIFPLFVFLVSRVKHRSTKRLSTATPTLLRCYWIGALTSRSRPGMYVSNSVLLVLLSSSVTVIVDHRYQP